MQMRFVLGSASPFQWTFTRKDLTALLAKLSTKAIAVAAA